MLMTNENVRLYPHDRVLAALVGPCIPRWITPNAITILRFFLTPFVLFFLWRESWALGSVLFFIAGFTDAVDGTLARTRRQITRWGTVADPLADKLLIGTVALLFIYQKINPIFAMLIVLPELFLGLSALVRMRTSGQIMSANVYGKIKMFLQVIGVFALLLHEIFAFAWLMPMALVVLSVSIVFACVSLATYGI